MPLSQKSISRYQRSIIVYEPRRDVNAPTKGGLRLVPEGMGAFHEGGIIFFAYPGQSANLTIAPDNVRDS
ncbi:MAG: hypothetical protein WA144_04175 [Candidatus Methanoperedens sp.]